MFDGKSLAAGSGSTSCAGVGAAAESTLTARGRFVRRRRMVSAALIVLVIPAIIALSVLFGNNSKYLIVSTLILILTIAPFFMIFENRKPRAREIVLVAVMATLTVMAQLLFHFIVPVQVGTAMVIISGIALGPEAGFLIGALSRFVCNFYLGQGTWTPWEMFCLGLLGFIAGFVFNRDEIRPSRSNLFEKPLEVPFSHRFKVIIGPVLFIAAAEAVAYVTFLIWPGTDHSFVGWRLYAFGIAGLVLGLIFQKKRLPVDSLTLSLFTFFTAFIIYGGIMNFYAMISTSSIPGGEPISLEALRTLYVSGVSYDALHGLTAALFVFFFGNAIIGKLERIKIKYGIYK